MLTVNHTLSNPSSTTESIFSAKQVSYRRTEQGVYGLSQQMEPGVYITLFDGTEIFHPEREHLKGEPNSSERFYVMNEHGKTIATYSI